MTNGNNKQVNPLVAGLTGAAIGAGVAVLTTKILTDKNMRDKIMRAAAYIKDKVSGSMYKAGEEISSTAHRIGISRKRKARDGGKGMSFSRK